MCSNVYFKRPELFECIRCAALQRIKNGYERFILLRWNGCRSIEGQIIVSVQMVILLIERR